ncbi:MgtC/SapB family protein [Terrarubrum flagellatum]|uniref:MgtC/SapB family protein n=1 Tax=Terrirubrum flagellatum TaxID=2895980 RepID=UPI003144EE37
METQSIAFVDDAWRLILAVVFGAALGLNRDLHGKPTGVRTLGLVSLGSALATLAVARSDPPGASRVVQGIVTGIGFLGAGVIIRTRLEGEVRGLTTAACVWLTACLGAACALADWRLLTLGVALALVILALGGPFERLVHRWRGGAGDQEL